MPTYDNHSERFSTISHLVGAIGALTTLVLLVVFASLYATVWHIVGFALFGTCLLCLYVFSTWYHATPHQNPRKHLLRRLDHASIFLLIAGTYTPVCFIPLLGSWGWSLFGIIWGLAILGFIWKWLHLPLPSWLSLTWYAVMGWLIMIAIVPLLHKISFFSFWLLLSGGLLYTIGIIFYAVDTKFRIKSLHGHDIFHIFVLLGSASHVWFMWKLLV